jgi:hypothetical protein
MRGEGRQRNGPSPGELVGVARAFGGGSSRTFGEQKEEGVITINLGSFARCRMARHYRRIAFANLPFPPLWFEGGYLNFKKAREGLIGHPANMRRAPSVCQCGTLHNQTDPLPGIVKSANQAVVTSSPPSALIAAPAFTDRGRFCRRVFLLLLPGAVSC